VQLRGNTLAPALVTALLIALAGGQAAARSQARRAAAQIERAAADLAVLAEHPFADAARGEIELLETWIEDAGNAVAAGKQRRAAILAERLPLQAALVRALLALAEERERNRELEERAGELRRELAVLRGRLDRLDLRRLGRFATWAHPPLQPAEDRR